MANLTKIVLAATLFTSTVASANDQTFLATYIHSEYNRPHAQARLIAEAVVKASKDFSVGQPLIMALIAKESSFIPNLSYHGAIGLTMVVESVHRDKLHGKNIRNINTNVSIGVKIFKECLESMRGNTLHALALYNRGCSIEPDHRMRKKIKEGSHYANWVINKSKVIKQTLSNLYHESKKG